MKRNKQKEKVMIDRIDFFTSSEVSPEKDPVAHKEKYEK